MKEAKAAPSEEEEERRREEYEMGILKLFSYLPLSFHFFAYLGKRGLVSQK